MKTTFFDEAGDSRMEKQNDQNWAALLEIIENNYAHLPRNLWDVLDIGSHTGRLLHLFQKGNDYTSLSGVEPLERARRKAKRIIPNATFYPSISKVPDQSMDVVISHEVLYLIEDLETWMQELKRILRPEGGAFIVLGSHAENTAWMRWRSVLQEKYEHVSYVHKPMDILRTGEVAGFDMELHRLHQSAEVSRRFSPPEDSWGEFASAQEFFDFNQQKLVFVFYPKK